MAEIIVEPTALSKVIALKFKINDVDVPKTTQLSTNKQFNTTDTDAWFTFELDGLAATNGTYDLTLINLDDKSIFRHDHVLFPTLPFHYKLNSSEDVTLNEIRHAGRWLGQLVVTLSNGDTTARQFGFNIAGHILDGQDAQVILLSDYQALINTINLAKDDLAQYNIDYAALIADVMTAEGVREQAEIDRAAVFATLVESEMVAQNVATKLAEKEATFAPRLLSLESELAEKINKGNVSVTDINKNLGKIDQTYISEELLQQIAGTTSINSTVAPLSTTSIKLADKAVSANKTNFFKVSTNLINEKTITKDKSIKASTGEVIDNAGGNSVTDFIPIQPNTAYTSYRAVRKAFYTDDRTFILSNTADGTWTTPANAYYVRIVATTSYFGLTAQLNAGSTLLPFEKYYEYIPFSTVGEFIVKNSDIENNAIEEDKTIFFETSTNLFNKNFIEIGVNITPTGDIIQNNQYHLSDYFIIKPDVKYTVTQIQRIAYFDENKNFIRAHEFIAYDTVDTTPNTSPSHAKYARVNVYRYRLDTAQINEGETLLPYDIGGTRLKGGYLPKKAVNQDHLENITLVEETSGENLTFDYDNMTLKRTKENRQVIDVDINKTFNKNVVFPDNSTVIRNSKSSDIYAMYDALMVKYPTYITKALLGYDTSPDAFPIYRYDFKPIHPDGGENLKVGKHILLSGTHPELSSVWTLYNTMENICDHWIDDELLEALRFNFHFIVIPVVSPWAYDNSSRTNHNGVDMARNFPSGWVQGTFGTPTYGGTSPLSEKEAQYINQLMLDNLDTLSVVDFHSFQGAVGSYDFLWLPTGNVQTSNIGMALIQRMDRKWKKEYLDFMNQSYDVFIGNVNGASGNLPGGSAGYQASAYGIRCALTYEMCDFLRADPTRESLDATVMGMGYEAFVNFLLIMSNTLINK